MPDHELGRRRVIDPDRVNDLSFDLLLSSYNNSQRVHRVFEGVNARRKIWAVHSEYAYDESELPETGEVWLGPASNEVEFWTRLMNETGVGANLPALNVAIDITGMTRPCIMLLPLMLRRFNARCVSVLYSDPQAYVAGASTSFSTGAVEFVAQVPGLEGVHSNRYGEEEALILGAGYDVELMKAVAESKKSARHLLIVGLPALQSHMYQESRLQIGKVEESINRFSSQSVHYAPASDPFVTASVVQKLVDNLRRDKPLVNIYVSAVGPKPQVLGFAWYVVCEPSLQGVSAIYPYASEYSKETSVGIARLHEFSLELDWIP